eukprot:CAMPEP_0116906468 /NCGR_PEP_ID=MMETSP0467-20121206/12540_1 /TAXON_ID=283647 /ORGANISM="Mesodinium pulex, Strain SPMC105" /LENGTH=33 /DNA_ID= /DNA_START= /DNA_END= /DNA_ORIENTATION=
MVGVGSHEPDKLSFGGVDVGQNGIREFSRSALV